MTPSEAPQDGSTLKEGLGLTAEGHLEPTVDELLA